MDPNDDVVTKCVKLATPEVMTIPHLIYIIACHEDFNPPNASLASRLAEAVSLESSTNSSANSNEEGAKSSFSDASEHVERDNNATAKSQNVRKAVQSLASPLIEALLGSANGSKSANGIRNSKLATLRKITTELLDVDDADLLKRNAAASLEQRTNFRVVAEIVHEMIQGMCSQLVFNSNTGDILPFFTHAQEIFEVVKVPGRLNDLSSPSNNFAALPIPGKNVSVNMTDNMERPSDERNILSENEGRHVNTTSCKRKRLRASEVNTVARVKRKN
jgi:hypothetical protein